jgi:hypothetical protein
MKQRLRMCEQEFSPPAETPKRKTDVSIRTSTDQGALQTKYCRPPVGGRTGKLRFYSLSGSRETAWGTAQQTQESLVGFGTFAEACARAEAKELAE